MAPKPPPSGSGNKPGGAAPNGGGPGAQNRPRPSPGASFDAGPQRPTHTGRPNAPGAPANAARPGAAAPNAAAARPGAAPPGAAPAAGAPGGPAASANGATGARPPTGGAPATPPRPKSSARVPRAAAPPAKKHFSLLGFLFTLLAAVVVVGFLGLAGAFFFASLYTPAKEVAVSAKKPAAPSAVRAAPAGKDDRVLIGKLLTGSDGKSFLANQPVEKRRQILIVDLFLQLLGRYPNVHEQLEWLEDTPRSRAVDAKLAKGVPEGDVANYVAAAVMDSKEYRDRIPEIRQDKPSGRPAAWLGALPAYGAPTVAAMIARAIHYRDDLSRKHDAALIERLAKDSDALGKAHHPAALMTELLRTVSGSTDVGEHWTADQKEDAVEVAAMRTLLRNGRYLVASGLDAEGQRRFLLLFGFAPDGAFLVRDPTGAFPERVSPTRILALLRRPMSEGQPAAGFWLDVSNRKSRTRCRPKVVARSGPTELYYAGDQGVTGVIPGAVVNLSPLRIPPGQHNIRGTMTISAEQVDQILRDAHSPAAGSGKSFIKWGRYYNIDPIYALAFFRRESVFGAHKRWVGRRPDGTTSKNIGNIRYFSAPSPERDPQYGHYNGFRAYATWDDGIHDWFKLLAQDSNYAGMSTVERILPRYAPSVENDTNNYIRDVITWVGQWRQQTLHSGDVRVVSASTASLASAGEMDCVPE